MRKVLLVDTHNLIHRARFGFGDGEHKIYYNFFRMLMGELKRHEPDIVYIVDEGSPVQSKALLADYKANRQKLADPQFHREKKEIFETIKSKSGLVYIRHPHFECDDVIGFLAQVTHKNDDVTIVSTDSDFIQLISNNVKLWHPKKKKYVDPWYCDYVTWKALKGDLTDNVSGVSGVGKKRADLLVQDPKELEIFLKSKPERQSQFDISYQVIKLKNVETSNLCVQQSDFFENMLLEEFSRRKFKSIISNTWPKWVNQFKKSGGRHDL